METVTVNLGPRSYDIIIGTNAINETGTYLNAFNFTKSAVIITNTTVASLYLDRLADTLSASSCNVFTIVLPDGEQYKSLTQMEHIYSRLLSFGIDRATPLIALGGGVVGDITGFAASTFMRGVPFVQIPTTLLAQVDSSVGGKTGINLPDGKNMAGTFYQPSLVIIDPQVLSTLPSRELKAGAAEVIKYGIIRSRSFFSYLETHMHELFDLNDDALIHIIKTCCSIKADIIVCDETETGVRAILNFGHTFAHALETLTEYTAYKHGEAVAVGMAVASRLSSHLGLCSAACATAVTALLSKASLPFYPDNLGFYPDQYLEIMAHDKKKAGQFIRMVLIEDIGRVCLKKFKHKELQAHLHHIL